MVVWWAVGDLAGGVMRVEVGVLVWEMRWVKRKKGGGLGVGGVLSVGLRPTSLGSSACAPNPAR